MNDGQLILITGALLAGGLVASFVAVRLRVPALVLFLGIGMLVGSDGTRLDRLQRLRARAHRRASSRSALILFEGGLATGFDEIRPVLRPALAWRSLGTLVTAVVAGLVAAWLFRLLDARGPAARLDPRRHRRRRDLRGPARLDAAPAGWRGRSRASRV